MSRLSLLLFCLVLTLTLAGASIANAHCGKCHAGSEKSTESCDGCAKHAEPEPLYTLQLGMSGYSPVSYLDQNRAQPGSPRFSAVHEGVTYFFASEQERVTFEKAPERYMPAYGGFCAFGCSVDSEFVPDPTSFQIIDGKTHLFLKNKEVDAKALWRDGDQAELLKKADAYWHSRSTGKADGSNK
jgi:YHS domain-containing protein